MKKFDVEYEQKLFHEELHFVDVEDTGNDKQNDQDAWNALRREVGVHRDNAYIQSRGFDLSVFGGNSGIEYRFIERVPVWVPGTIVVFANTADAAIIEARAVLGGDIAVNSVEEV